jgi:hypothetical protein
MAVTEAVKEGIQGPEGQAGASSGPQSPGNGRWLGQMAERLHTEPLVAVGELSAQEISTEIQVLQVLTGALQARTLALLAEVEKRGLDKKEGCLSLAQFAAKHLKLTPRNAAAMSSLAGSLAGLEVFSEALSQGTLSLDQLKPLARVTTKSTQHQVLQKAQGLSALQCRNLARGIELERTLSTSAHGDPRRHAHERRYLSIAECADGTWALGGLMGPTEGAGVYKVLSELARKAPVNPETGVYDSWGKRMCDALVDLVMEPDAKGRGRAQLVIHVSQEVIEGRKEGLAAMEAGETGIIPLGAETLLRLSCDALVQVLIEDAQGRPLSMSQARRSVPFSLRSLLSLRDGICRFPGCDNGIFLHAHHIAHWSKGGPTTKDNLVLICSRHHRIVHEGHWQILGNPSGEISFVSPEGLSYTSSPMPP